MPNHLIPTTPSFIEEVVKLVLEGARNQDIAEEMGISLPTFAAMRRRSPELEQAYLDAKADHSDNMVDELLAEVSAPISTIQTERGEIPNMAEVQRLRLKADVVKWVVGKHNPRRYGDRIDVSGTIEHKVSPLEQLRQLKINTKIPPPTVDVTPVLPEPTEDNVEDML